jgi:hypothetical protein
MIVYACVHVPVRFQLLKQPLQVLRQLSLWDQFLHGHCVAAVWCHAWRRASRACYTVLLGSFVILMRAWNTGMYVYVCQDKHELHWPGNQHTSPGWACTPWARGQDDRMRWEKGLGTCIMAEYLEDTDVLSARMLWPRTSSLAMNSWNNTLSLSSSSKISMRTGRFRTAYARRICNVCMHPKTTFRQTFFFFGKHVRTRAANELVGDAQE